MDHDVLNEHHAVLKLEIETVNLFTMLSKEKDREKWTRLLQTSIQPRFFFPPAPPNQPFKKGSFNLINPNVFNENIVIK